MRSFPLILVSETVTGGDKEDERMRPLDRRVAAFEKEDEDDGRIGGMLELQSRYTLHNEKDGK